MNLRDCGLGIVRVTAFSLTRFLASLLSEVTSAKTADFAKESALLYTVALLACLLSARKAAKVNSNQALRHESFEHSVPYKSTAGKIG